MPKAGKKKGPGPMARREKQNSSTTAGSTTPHAPATTPSTPLPPEALAIGIGKIQYNGEVIDCGPSDVLFSTELGEGSFGCVKKVTHKIKKMDMAVKIMRDTARATERRRLVTEVQTILKAQSCAYTVDYYGVALAEGDVWIFMELMQVSLNVLYKRIKPDVFPEAILARIAVNVLDGLRWLKSTLEVMHRDIKPSNLLMGYDGVFKICDFGISKNMDQSLLVSNVGCEPYLSPERINPSSSTNAYGVEADVWSYGMTLVELGSQRYPYHLKDEKNIFSLLSAIVNEPSPKLPENYSEDFRDFVSECLVKTPGTRRRYERPPRDLVNSGGQSLIEHPFYLRAQQIEVDVKAWYAPYACADGGGGDGMRAVNDVQWPQPQCLDGTAVPQGTTDELAVPSDLTAGASNAGDGSGGEGDCGDCGDSTAAS